MADATTLRPESPHLITVAAAVSAWELRQGPDGRAYYRKSATGAASADANVQFVDNDQVTVPKTTGVVFLDGGRAYWDRSAAKAHFKRQNDRDYYIGRFVGDAASADTTCTVKLNKAGEFDGYEYDLIRDAHVTSLTGTQALGGFGIYDRGGARKIIISATNEAQKADMLSRYGFATGANAIVEIGWVVVDDGSGTVVDVSLGIANDTHADNADTITDSVFIHLNANDVNIYAESDDGTTEVAATDTTIDYTAGTRHEAWLDMRNPADIQIYIDGVLILPATIFNVNASTATWKLLAHVEKSSSTDTFEIDIDFLRVRTAEQ